MGLGRDLGGGAVKTANQVALQAQDLRRRVLDGGVGECGLPSGAARARGRHALGQRVEVCAVAPPARVEQLGPTVASTLVVSLELARAGEITLHQDGGFGDITVHAAPAVAQETPTAEAGG